MAMLLSRLFESREAGTVIFWVSQGQQLHGIYVSISPSAYIKLGFYHVLGTSNVNEGLCGHLTKYLLGTGSLRVGAQFLLVFVACEIFTCEIEVILKTLMDDDEFQLKGLLSSFMGPNHPHIPLLVGYFSKLRKFIKVYHGVDGKKGGGRHQANLTPWKERPCKWRHQSKKKTFIDHVLSFFIPHVRTTITGLHFFNL
ncbi:hypothetical protein C5167_030534 [Papaver somniferum]|nr:hypothetical protein C5167_030534 [Papaver somniferum]